MNLGPHADFIIAAYAVAALVVIGADRLGRARPSAQRRMLGELEARGVTRRSQRNGGPHERGLERTGSGKTRRRILVLLPLIVFLALAALFLFRLGAAIRRSCRPR